MNRSTFVAAVCGLASVALGQTVVGGPVRNSANGHRYYLLEALSWSEAEAWAVGAGGHLATVNDAAENDWIRANIANFGGEGRKVFIGLNDTAVEGTFAWSSGEPVEYTNWAPGEPSNSATKDVAYLRDNDGQWHCVVPTFTEFAVVETSGDLRVPEEFATIQAAISAALDGEAISVGPGTYVGLVTLDGMRLTIRSRAGALATVLDAQHMNWTLYVRQSVATISGFTISGGFIPNTDGGGLVVDSEADVRVVDCVITNNRSHFIGGGVFVQNNSAIELVNCLIYANDAISGSALFLYDGTALLRNCTIAGNTGTSIVQHELTGSTTIWNSVLWGNYGTLIDQNLVRVEVGYSVVQGGWPGEGNLDVDPLFADPDGHDYRILAGSPCIDAADNAKAASGMWDLAGGGRVVDDPSRPNGPDPRAPIDIGAYEFQGTSCPGDFNGDGSLNIFDFLAFQTAFGSGC